MIPLARTLGGMDEFDQDIDPPALAFWGVCLLGCIRAVLQGDTMVDTTGLKNHTFAQD